MPTISQLPPADPVSAADLLPISQAGSAHSVSVGVLLSQTQPAISISPPSLLGRFSIGPGGPDSIAVGQGLAINNGTLNASLIDLPALPAQSAIAGSDQLVAVNGGTAQLVDATQIRALFAAGSNITIDSNGTISTSISGSTLPFTFTTLSPVTSLAQGDLVAVNQGGVDHTIPYGDFIDGLTIDQTQPAGPASDADTFWTAQTTNVMLRQTIGALWPWVSGKLPSWKKLAQELTVDTTLDSAAHNNAILICSSPVLIFVPASVLGSGFSCDLINASGGQVTLSGNVLTSNGSLALGPSQTCVIRCVTYSGGTAAFASIGAGGMPTSLPGQASNLLAVSTASASVGLSWSAPAVGGTVVDYVVQYRVTGTTPWSTSGQASGATNFTVTGLQASSSYDFVVVASNSVGSGLPSGILTVATPAGVALPGAPNAVSISNVTANAMNCSWTAPLAGGTVATYSVQYSTSGQSVWTTAATNLTTMTVTITGLAAATDYLVQVIASNSAGSGPPSASATATTTAAAGLVTSITWNVAPAGSYVSGTGAIGVNAHVAPATSAIQFGFSASQTVPPSAWTVATNVNTDLWGAYVPTPTTPGTWFAWAEGTDGSAPTAYGTSFVTT